MKVKLRLQNGIITGSLDIPDHCLREYKIPVHREMKAHLIGQIQDMITPETTQNKCLIFRWDGKSKWGGNDHPIMDLVDIF